MPGQRIPCLEHVKENLENLKLYSTTRLYGYVPMLMHLFCLESAENLDADKQTKSGVGSIC